MVLTTPRTPFWLAVSPTPAFFPVFLGFYPPQGTPSGWSFAQPPAFFLVLAGSSWVLPNPRTSFWFVVSQTPAFFPVLLGFYPPQGPPSGWSFPQLPAFFPVHSGSSVLLLTLRIPPVGRFPNPPSLFFWGFTHPKYPLLVGRFPNPPPSFWFFRGFSQPKDLLLIGRFPNTPPFFWFFRGFTQPKDSFLVGRFPNPPPSFFFCGSTHPKYPFWLAVSPTTCLFLDPPGFYSPQEPLLVDRIDFFRFR